MASRIVYVLTLVTSSHEGGGPPVPSPCEHILQHMAVESMKNGGETGLKVLSWKPTCEKVLKPSHVYQ